MKWESGNDRPVVQPSPGFPNVVRYERCDYLPQGVPGRARISETLYTSSPPTFVEIHSPRTVSSDMYKVINRPPAEVDGIPNFRGSPDRTIWSMEQDVPYPVHAFPPYYPFPEQPAVVPRDSKEPANARRTYDKPHKKPAKTPPKAYEPGKVYEPAYSPSFTEELRRSEYIKSIGHPYNPGLLKSYVESYNQGFVHLNGYTQDDADRIFGKDMTPNPQFMMYPHFKGPPVVYNGLYNPNMMVINRTVSSSTSDLPKKRGPIRRHSILKPENHMSSHSLRRRGDSPSVIARNIYNLSTPDSSAPDSPIPSRPQSPSDLNHFPEENPPFRADRESQTNTSFLLKNFLKREQREKEQEEYSSPHKKGVSLNPITMSRVDGSGRERKKKFLRKAIANDSSSTFVYDSRKQKTEEAKMVRQSLKDKETETNPLETDAKGIQTSATNLNNKQYRTRSTSVGSKLPFNERGKSPVVIKILEVEDEDQKSRNSEKEGEQYKKPPSEGAKATISMSSLVDLTETEKPSKSKKASDKRSKSRSLKRKCSRDSIREGRGSKRSSPTRSENRCSSKNSPSFIEHKSTKTAIMESRRKLLWKRTSEEEILAKMEMAAEVKGESEERLEENEIHLRRKRKRSNSGDCGSPCKEKTKSGTASPKERHMSIAAQKLSTKPKTYDKRSLYRCGTLRPEPETPHNWQCFMMHKQELDDHRMPEEARMAKKRQKKPTIPAAPSDIPAGVENELRHLKSQLFHLRKEWAHFSSNSTTAGHQKDRRKRKPIQIDPAEDWIVM
ncbi:uncharacterized protein LOC106671942 isoform X2 [Cimex lectularius]|uniref:Uncharacterized protein n=1 Tax=Cimex lectularius TaxID=79782 RepID=A0A8I6S3W6_CIMLE|nr:uncharacterized protein LOC106671942 isoform X1 [Cimex lectularius]XP_014258431.1 uncharacterized protein LOC106671942 isoform X2 [Cimex lectularius]